MTISEKKIYPRTGDRQTVYLKNVIKNAGISIGDYTMYNDFVHDPRDFEKNNVLYYYPVNKNQLRVGKFCSIACGAKFLFTSANHTMRSLSTYPFPIFFEEWGLDVKDITSAWDNKGDIVIGNDVWIGTNVFLLAGVKIGDGAIIGAGAIVTHDVEPYAVVGGVPAKVIRYRYPKWMIESFMRIQWWDWSLEKIEENIELFYQPELFCKTFDLVGHT